MNIKNNLIVNIPLCLIVILLNFTYPPQNTCADTPLQLLYIAFIVINTENIFKIIDCQLFKPPAVCMLIDVYQIINKYIWCVELTCMALKHFLLSSTCDLIGYDFIL